MDCKGIERGLRGVVGEVLRARDGRTGRGVQRQRAENAGQVDDAAGGTALQQREQRLGKLDDGKEVRIEGAAQLGLGDGGRIVTAKVAFGEETGVIYQDIEAARSEEHTSELQSLRHL